MEPRTIAPQDIRVGMRVRREDERAEIRTTYEFVVAAVHGGFIEGPRCNSFPLGECTWTLLDRPAPDRPVGSHWRGTVYEGVVEYVLNQNGDYLPIRQPEGWSVAALRRGYEDDEIARLTPIPAFDPATLWPRADFGQDRCGFGMDDSVHNCDRAPHTSGMHACHHIDTLYVWGDPR